MRKTRETVPTRKVSSWKELREVLEELVTAGWAFRGQAKAAWRLESSLTRYLTDFGLHRDAWLKQEKHMLATFRRKAHLLLPRTPEEGETLEWLALMQHHGAPTRLLDFTWSPYVAAFFALERATEDAAIYAICSCWDVPNFQGWYLSALLNRVSGFKPAATLTDRDREAAEGEKIPDVLMGEPFLMNQRMTTQAGTFIIPTRRIDVPVDALVPRSSILKLWLKTKSLRTETMTRLYEMNINPATLFPGLDGLARSLAYELEFAWAVDPDAGSRVAQRPSGGASPGARH
jgi:hypothetical protein